MTSKTIVPPRKEVVDFFFEANLYLLEHYEEKAVDAALPGWSMLTYTNDGLSMITLGMHQVTHPYVHFFAVKYITFQDARLWTAHTDGTIFSAHRQVAELRKEIYAKQYREKQFYPELDVIKGGLLFRNKPARGSFANFQGQEEILDLAKLGDKTLVISSHTYMGRVWVPLP